MRAQKRAASDRSCSATTTVRPAAASRASRSNRVELVGGIEAGGRLVGEQDRRLLGQRAGDQHAGALAARQLGAPAGRGKRRRPSSAMARSTAARRFGIGAGRPVRQAAERDDARDASAASARALLRQVGDGAGASSGGRSRRASAIVERRRRRASGRMQAGERAQQVDLPAPFGPITAVSLAGARRERDVVEHGARARARTDDGAAPRASWRELPPRLEHQPQEERRADQRREHAELEVADGRHQPQRDVGDEHAGGAAERRSPAAAGRARGRRAAQQVRHDEADEADGCRRRPSRRRRRARCRRRPRRRRLQVDAEVGARRPRRGSVRRGRGRATAAAPPPATMNGAASPTCTRLRSVSEPSIQNTISTAANGLGDRLRASEVRAPARLEIATPARMSVTGPLRLPASATTASVAAPAPARPPAASARRRRRTAPVWIASTAPSAAPPETPIRPGSASGLRR